MGPSIPHFSSRSSHRRLLSFLIHYTLPPITGNKPRHLRLPLSLQKPENLLERLVPEQIAWYAKYLVQYVEALPFASNRWSWSTKPLN